MRHASSDLSTTQVARVTASTRGIGAQPDRVTGLLSVTIASSEGELEDLAGDWAALFAQTPMASAFEAHAWISGCWRRRPSAYARLYVGVVRIDGRCVAIAPAQLDGGTLRFVGREDSNYSGPVYMPQHLDEAVTAWARHLAADPDVRAVDLGGLRGGLPFTDLVTNGLPHWGPPVVVRSNLCPEVDLSPGWEGVYGRHKRKTRSMWRRQEARISLMGDVRIELLTEPADVASELPGLFQLWEAHFRGQRISGGFSRDRQDFQTFMATHGARAGLVELWVMRLDGEVIAFSYGLRGRDSTTSYVVAYEDALAVFSPGKLLLLRILERAASSHDPVYDFSLGEASYKAQWATGTRPVYRLRWGRSAALRAARDRAWVRARDIPWLRRLKVEGISSLQTAEPASRLPDTPGLPAGGQSATMVYEIPGRTDPVALRKMQFAEMRALLSPRLLRFAAEAIFRGDSVHAAEQDGQVTGVVFCADAPRRAMFAGEHARQHAGAEVYYRLVARGHSSASKLAAALPGPCLLLAASAPPGGRLLGAHDADGA